MEALVQQWEKDLASLSTAEQLRLIAAAFPGEVVFSTSFGKEDQVVSYFIRQSEAAIALFTLDTGRLFPETYAVWDKTMARYGLTIKAYYPPTEAVEVLVTTKGVTSFYESVENRKECCHIRKVIPLNRALAGAKVWVTGLRAEQSTNRSTMQLVEWDEQRKLIKFNPLIHWTEAEVDAFIQAQNIPYHSLHDAGYPSIGCQPCTRAVLPGEDSRAGRWWWEESKKECGLHASN